MQQVKSRVDTLSTALGAKLDEEKRIARNTIEERKTGLSAMEEFFRLSPERQSQLILPFETFLRNLERQTLIAVIRDTLHRFEDEEYPRILTQLSAWAKPEPQKGGDKSQPDKEPLTVKEKPIEYVPGKAIRTAFDKPWLADESDVDRYLAKLKEALMKEIASGKRIQI